MSDLQGFGFVLPHWAYWGWLAIMPLIMMWLMRDTPKTEDEIIKYDGPTRPLTRAIDLLSNASGIFVSLWTVNAVVFYFYEVVMRYVFNMPTIWVHEASYLMFGMQYVLTGAFALLHGAHVKVDIIYVRFSKRMQVALDILTSVFFFIFALALAGTSWTFFKSSYEMKEISLETWGIEYYPVKFALFLGAVLILLAGVSKLIKDILLLNLLAEGEAE